jgi:hypothetical protein
MVWTLLADLSLPIENSGRAQETVVLQGLNNRHVCLETRFVNGRRDHHERIGYVNDLWFMLPDHLGDRLFALFAKYDALDQCQSLKPRELVYLMIAALVNKDFVAVLFQYTAFLLEDHIFPAGLLIGVMSEQYFHRRN